MKRYCLPLALLTFFTQLQAQEPYVEVIVQDTVLVEPQEWVYGVTISRGYETVAVPDTIAMPYNPPERKNKTKATTIADVKTLISKHNGTVASDSGQSKYILRRDFGYEPEYLVVKFTSRKSLEDFIAALSKMQDVEGRMITSTHSNLQEAYAQLDVKLMLTASKRAEALARLSQKKAGAVLFISEDTDGGRQSFKDFLETMIKYDGPGRKADLLMQADKIKIEKSLKVRFALLP